MSWAEADTDPTIRQVKAHNAVGHALCGWRGLDSEAPTLRRAVPT